LDIYLFSHVGIFKSSTLFLLSSTCLEQLKVDAYFSLVHMLLGQLEEHTKKLFILAILCK